MEELFGEDSGEEVIASSAVQEENNREDSSSMGDDENVTPPTATTITTPHDIQDIDEDDDRNDIPDTFPDNEKVENHPKTALRNNNHDEERDLFGSDDEAELEEAEIESFPNETNKSLQESLLTRQSQENEDLFGSDDDAQGGDPADYPDSKNIPTSSHSKLCIPNITHLPDNSQILLKMPGFVKFQPKPYNSATYDGEMESTLFTHAPAMIRWRYKRQANGEIMKDADGKPLRESNARLVKFSDGTYQLLVGDETFECQLVPVSDSFIYSQQYSAPPKDSDSIREGSQSDIKKGSVLECIGSFTNKLNILVSSVTSVTHERMSLKTNEQYRKAVKIKTRESEINPEKEYEARIGAINEQLKRERKRALQLQSDSYSRGSVGHSSRASMSAAYLQEGFDDDRNYDSVSLRKIKKGESGFKKFGKKDSSTKKSINLEDDDDEDDEEEDDGDPTEMNDFIVNSGDEEDEEEEEEGDYEDEDEEDEDDAEEEDDDDGETGVSKKKSAKLSSKSSSKDRNKATRSKPSKKSSKQDDEDEEVELTKRKTLIDENDEDENQHKKRLKRTIVDSDED